MRRYYTHGRGPWKNVAMKIERGEKRIFTKPWLTHVSRIIHPDDTLGARTLFFHITRYITRIDRSLHNRFTIPFSSNRDL